MRPERANHAASTLAVDIAQPRLYAPEQDLANDYTIIAGAPLSDFVIAGRADEPYP
jgi:hypothetical protein